MTNLDELYQKAPEIEAKLGYRFHDRSLLILAFVHRSFVNENRALTEAHNERLEFLGDAILGMLIAEYLYKYYPSTPEGELSYLRSRLVEASSCVEYVQSLHLDQYLLLGKGEKMNSGRGRESILADFFEAIIGGIYLDGGLESAKRFLFKNFSRNIDAILKKPAENWKALLQDYSQKKYGHPPDYIVLEESGPDHNKIFEIAVHLNQKEIGRGKGNSKKEAQQKAAEEAYTRLSKTEDMA